MTNDPSAGKGNWHPSERDLLLYLNGELKVKSARKIQRHLQGCWSCSVIHEQMSSAIGSFMRSRQSILANAEFPARADRTFEARLHRLSAQSHPGDSLWIWERVKQVISLRNLPAGLAASVGILVALAFVWIRLSSIPIVSAREILDLAERAESKRLGEVARPVVHKQMQLTRRPPNGRSAESIRWEIWCGPGNERFSQRIHDGDPHVITSGHPAGTPAEPLPPILADLDEVLRWNQMHEQPMSAAAFARWHSRLDNPSDRVTETALAGGDKAVAIATSLSASAAPNSIVRAELVVRREDWHPVEQRLSVVRADGLHHFEMSETSYEVVSLHTLSPSIFQELSPPLPLPRLASAPTNTLDLEPKPSSLDLEVALQQKLHELKACLGEEIKVTRSPAGFLEVRGFVESSARRAELQQGLQSFTGVGVSIRTLAEANPSSPIAGSVVSPSEERTLLATRSTGSLTQTQSSTFRDYLVDYFSRNSEALVIPSETGQERTLSVNLKAVEFSNEMVTLSQEVHVQAWAFRRLIERYDEAALQRLSPESLAMLRRLIGEHLENLGHSIEQSDALLCPVLLALVPGRPAVQSEIHLPEGSAAESLSEQSMQLFGTVIKADRRMLDLLNDSQIALLQNAQELLQVMPGLKQSIFKLKSRILETPGSSVDHLPAKAPVNAPQSSKLIN